MNQLLVIFVMSWVAVGALAATSQAKKPVSVENEVVTEAKEQKKEQNFFLSLDGTSLLLNGAGVKGTYIVNSYMSVGGAIKSFQLDSDNDETAASLNTQYQHELTLVGALVDLFPFGQARSNGLYLSLAATQVNLTTTVRDSIFGRNKASDSRTGAQASLGYQIVSSLRGISDQAQLTVQLGAGYGNGGGVRWRYFSGATTEVRDSVVLDLMGGIQF